MGRWLYYYGALANSRVLCTPAFCVVVGNCLGLPSPRLSFSATGTPSWSQLQRLQRRHKAQRCLLQVQVIGGGGAGAPGPFISV
ncbi:hypothetical protein PR003_g15179 [Phytophthora rubi]|uniref:Uncharacterized protein n=1 Tax=Phytophthora rubi TaxID=129364 RepID=A0A6A4ESE6_9STRA|nr:hypothetical protein PR002_g14917 [Phytophthora rubi]KAE9331020.1 hypothetical protein PR003_g15179 [Phytophthora rubi]